MNVWRDAPHGLAHKDRGNGHDAEVRTVEGLLDIGRKLNALRDWHAGEQAHILAALAEDASIFLAGAPKDDAMVGVLIQDQSDGRAPGAVSQHGKFDWHDRCAA